jgi:hypothetical protein
VAIAFDATSQGTLVNPGLTSTWSHTCTGANRILWVGFFADSQSHDTLNNELTGVTYAAVAMTRAGTTYCPGDRWTYLYYLVNPATGANNIVITSTFSGALQGSAISYTGAKQTGLPDAAITKQTSSLGANTNYTTTLTTIADQAWTILVAKSSAGTVSASTGSTVRQSGSGNILADSNGAITPAGSTGMSLQSTAISNWGSVMASFAPAATAGGTAAYYASYYSRVIQQEVGA